MRFVNRTKYGEVKQIVDRVAEIDELAAELLSEIKFMRVVYIERGTRHLYWWRGTYYPSKTEIALRFNRDESVYTVRKFKENRIWSLEECCVKVLGHELYHHEEHRRKLNKSQGYWSHKNCDAFGDALWQKYKKTFVDQGEAVKPVRITRLEEGVASHASRD